MDLRNRKRNLEWRVWLMDLGVRNPRGLRPNAIKLGLRPRHLWAIATGKYMPKLGIAIRVSRVLGVSVDAVAVACERAQERYRARLAVEQARRDAERQ